ncbi:hypothetical protein JR316_0010831 [Psilocybe cubensis]|uniref:Uncharacterized protein n=1 Tax=Psilocybe cubensis TaxID=181762 RepID=A0ACB8GPI5_PSICU|nr:hypothetical protein JR316_0010831 [Psilocybe cubensis]KAH9476915.1 hypothetical protein JR316_0010831 [Psilocybe cubensis]
MRSWTELELSERHPKQAKQQRFKRSLKRSQGHPRTVVSLKFCPKPGLIAALHISMASQSTKALSQKLTVIAETWIKDPFRPNLQLQTFLKSLAAHPRLTPKAVEATRALRDDVMHQKVALLPRDLA